ncbi:MAG: F0F1 ATP synthase subunit A [Candidatus Omnitrophota bacterium]
MQELANFPSYAFKLPFIGWVVTVNHMTLITSAVIILSIMCFLLLTVRVLKKFPSRRQVIAELTVGWFDDLLKDSIGEDGRKFLPFIVTLFLFVLLSNWITIIPRCPSPTKDINTCLGLGLTVLVVVHVSAIRKKGLLKYLKSYMEPVWFLLPSNVFSEVSKVLSHSFRLFGNIFAGGLVIGIVPFVLWKIFKWFALPISVLSLPVLNAFFGLFIGAVQAFVFTLLAVAYISVLRES